MEAFFYFINKYIETIEAATQSREYKTVTGSTNYGLLFYSSHIRYSNNEDLPSYNRYLSCGSRGWRSHSTGRWMLSIGIRQWYLLFQADWICFHWCFTVARGTGEPTAPAYGVIIGDPLFRALKKLVPDVTGYSVNYPASSNPCSRDKGGEDVIIHLKSQSAKCPNQKYALVGYSQGAGVMHQAMSKIDSSLYPKIIALVMFGDFGKHRGKIRYIWTREIHWEIFIRKQGRRCEVNIWNYESSIPSTTCTKIKAELYYRRSCQWQNRSLVYQTNQH